MRLSQLLGKRIVNIFDGEIMGSVGDSDLIINPETGDIEGIILPYGAEKIFNKASRAELNIPWSKVCKIGTEVIVVDVDYK